jgi:hypothetical protein
MKNLRQVPRTKILSLLLTCACIAFNMHCVGQDTIVKRDGQLVIGYVTEISPAEVKYKKVGVPEGPIYIEDKATIARIIYKNGVVDVFPELTSGPLPGEKDEYVKETADYRKKLMLKRVGGKYVYGDQIISERQMHEVLLSSNNPKLIKEIEGAKRASRLRYIGFAAIPLLVGTIGVLAASQTSFGGSARQQENIASLLFAGAALTFGTSIYFNIRQKHHNKEAIELYRQQYQ